MRDVINELPLDVKSIVPVHEIDPELDGLVINFSHLFRKFNLVDAETDTLKNLQVQ